MAFLVSSDSRLQSARTNPESLLKQKVGKVQVVKKEFVELFDTVVIYWRIQISKIVPSFLFVVEIVGLADKKYHLLW